MNGVLTIPSSAEIARRIKQCRDEMAALRRLYRLAATAEQAEAAAQRPPVMKSGEAPHHG